MDQLPIKIDHPPIVMVMLELRFSALSVEQTKLQTELKRVANAKDISFEQLRNVPEKGRYEWQFVLFKKKDPSYSRVNIGSNVISVFLNTHDYPGWTILTEQVVEWFKLLFDFQVFQNRSIYLYGHRINNLFTGYDDYSRILNLEINSGVPSYYYNLSEKLELRVGLKDVSHKIVVENNRRHALTKAIGLDITTSHIPRQPEKSDISGCLNEFNRLHIEEKKIFFSFLRPEYLQQLNPVYT